MGFVLLLWVLGLVDLGKQSVGREEDIPMNLPKQALCSCLALPRTTAQTHGGQTDRCGSWVLLLRAVFLPYYFTANTKQWWKHLSLNKKPFPWKGKWVEAASPALKVLSPRNTHCLPIPAPFSCTGLSVHHCFLVCPSFQMLQIAFSTLQLPTYLWQRSHESKLSSEGCTTQMRLKGVQGTFDKRLSHLAGGTWGCQWKQKGQIIDLLTV